MDVYTNVDPAAQQQLWNIYNTDMYVSYPDDLLQVASTVVDVSNGKVVAQLGGRKQKQTSRSVPTKPLKPTATSVLQ